MGSLEDIPLPGALWYFATGNRYPPTPKELRIQRQGEIDRRNMLNSQRIRTMGGTGKPKDKLKRSKPYSFEDFLFGTIQFPSCKGVRLGIKESDQSKQEKNSTSNTGTNSHKSSIAGSGKEATLRSNSGKRTNIGEDLSVAREAGGMGADKSERQSKHEAQQSTLKQGNANRNHSSLKSNRSHSASTIGPEDSVSNKGSQIGKKTKDKGKQKACDPK